jgi:hypothetical protein
MYAQNLHYAVNDVHTLTVPKSEIEISLAKQLMNDTVDMLNIKESEFGGNKKFDAIGDLDGNGVKLRYGITNDLMINLDIQRQNIQYSDNTLTNKKEDIYLRYNIFQNEGTFFNSGVSIDIGYVRNKLDNFYMKDINIINDTIAKILPNENAKLVYEDGSTKPKGYYANFDSTSTNLNDEPYISLEDTLDKSNFIRLITGWHTIHSTTDFYIGIKNTKIKTTISTTDEILDLANKEGYDLEQNLNRSEKMYMAGFNYSIEHKKFIYEFGFEYDKFIRDEGLDYIDYNYIFDMSITRYINKNLSVFVGSKIMYRQLNGQIPYLYNTYTQTSYDHKYGYVNAGIQFNF